jgi:transposase
MANCLKMEQKQQIYGLLELGWSYRRIQRETGVRRETVARYHRQWLSKAAKVPTGSEKQALSLELKAAGVLPGSPPNMSTAAPHEAFIKEELSKGLSYQRIWQDLAEEYGYAGGYDSVRRFAGKLKEKHRELADVMHSLPGEEAQVDFFSGPATFDADGGKWRRPWVFRMVLACSRHSYEEAVWTQDVLSFIRCHEHAFASFGGVAKVVRLDNLKAGVARACLYDPDIQPVYEAFSSHEGFVPLPCRPSRPQEKGKIEKAGDYLKDNALKGKKFDSLEELNHYLARWNRNIASLRIHGTTRQQVITHFTEVEKAALLPLPERSFEHFHFGTRKVHPDGHIQVANAYYSVPHHLLGETVTVRWTDKMVKVYHDNDVVAVHARAADGSFSTRSEHRPAHKPASAEGYERYLLSRSERIGPGAHSWAKSAIETRGPRSYRLIQGMLALTRTNSPESVDWACRVCQKNHCYRHKPLKKLLEGSSASASDAPALLQEHELIRPLAEIGKEMTLFECRD